MRSSTGFSGNLEGLAERFVDVAWTYRFGPPARDLIVMSLEQDGGDRTELLSQAFRLPAGRPVHREAPARLGVSATLRQRSSSGATVTVSAERFLYGVRVSVPGFRAQDDGSASSPGTTGRVELMARTGDGASGRSSVTALNLDGRRIDRAGTID